MSDINDLVGFAIDKNPVEFTESFNDILSSKIEEAVNARRVELAQSLYSEDADDDAVDSDDDFEYTDADLEDTDLDTDLDLDDIDVSDLDSDFESDNDGDDA